MGLVGLGWGEGTLEEHGTANDGRKMTGLEELASCGIWTRPAAMWAGFTIWAEPLADRRLSERLYFTFPIAAETRGRLRDSLLSQGSSILQTIPCWNPVIKITFVATKSITKMTMNKCIKEHFGCYSMHGR